MFVAHCFLGHITGPADSSVDVSLLVTARGVEKVWRINKWPRLLDWLCEQDGRSGGQSEESRFGNFVEFHQFATERVCELSVAQRVAK